MSLSLHIAQGNARRVAGKKGQQSCQPGSVCCGRIAACAYYPNTERSDQYMKARSGDASPSPALYKQPITESPTMRSIVSNGITSPVAFKAIRYRRRVQLWNRQVSIIKDLTTLTLRHERRYLPRV